MKSNRQFRKSRNQFFKRGFHRTYTMFLPKMLRSFFLQVTMSDTLNISSFLLFCYCFFICVAHVLRVRLVISVHPPPPWAGQNLFQAITKRCLKIEGILWTPHLNKIFCWHLLYLPLPQRGIMGQGWMHFRPPPRWIRSSCFFFSSFFQCSVFNSPLICNSIQKDVH